MAKLLDFKGIRAGSPLKIRAAATEAEIIIYAGIGQDWWGDGSMVSAKAFSDELKKVPEAVNTLNVRINSPGGDVFDGLTIYNRILDWKKKVKGRTVNVFIDGLAASIASVIALAGDDVKIGEGALYMIHLPWTFAYGNRMELDNTINRLMDVEEQMLGIYAKKSGLERSEIRSLLEAETWMDAEQALEKGFVDSKAEDTVAIAASALNKSPWIIRKPENYFSDREATAARVADLKAKVQAKLAK